MRIAAVQGFQKQTGNGRRRRERGQKRPPTFLILDQSAWAYLLNLRSARLLPPRLARDAVCFKKEWGK